MEIIMKRLIAAVSAFTVAATCLMAQDPEGTLTYALPQTVVTVEVEAVQEIFYAGPYARYASKYLGSEARNEDEVSCQVTSVKLTPFVEADQSARYTVNPGKSMPAFLSLTAQGLIASGDGISGKDVQWRFAAPSRGDFSDKGVESNLTSESATLYRNVKGESAYSKVAVQQQMVVEKSLETRAKEAADMIFRLRRKRIDIITGDTDATYSGEAMASAIEELSRLEKEYMTLFYGYSELRTQKMSYDIVPSASNQKQMYIAFRISDKDGLVAADNMSGKPYVLELVPQKVAAPAASASGKGSQMYYRVPAICFTKLSDGVNVILQTRIPVYQLGVVSSYPVSSK